jgi:hypothetical protein
LPSAALGAVVILFSARMATAVIVAGDYQNTSDATVNITPPASDPGFYNVGATGSASAIYLGNDWVLTASHVTVGATTFSFPDATNSGQIDTATYNIVANSGIILTNPTGANAGTNSDLILYKIDPTSSSFGEPNLPHLLLSSSAPTVGQTVMAIGRGADRADSLTYWDSSRPVWQTTPQASAIHSGYLTTGPHVERWGENTVSTASMQQNMGTTANPIWIQAFSTTFNSGASALANEFQVTLGDSGGAVFTQFGNTWMLSGMIDSIGLQNGQPYSTNGNTNTAAFGDTSILADISFYRDQILSLVPLPGDVNHDGIVNAQDLALVSSNWLATGTGVTGDLNGDGVVNAQDLAIVSSNWTTATSNAPLSGGGQSAGGTNVPEPATALLALLAGLLLWAARRQLSR